MHRAIEQYVVFVLGERRFCLRLNTVERVVHVAEIPPLPKAPDIVMAVLNVGGELIPVVDIRKRFALPPKDVNLSDQIIIAQTDKRKVAMIVDTVTGVIRAPQGNMAPAASILSDTDYLAGVIKLPDGLVLIHDLDTFLSLGEKKALESAIE